MQKRSYHFLTELSLQSQTYFQRPSQARKGKSIPQKSIDGSVKTAYLILYKVARKLYDGVFATMEIFGSKVYLIVWVYAKFGHLLVLVVHRTS